MGQRLPRRPWIAAVLAGGAALAGAAVAPPAALADRNGFYMRNQADVTVTAIYVSPIFSKRWRDDRLSGDAVAPGTETWVPVEVDGEAGCFFDIRAENGSDQPFELWGIDLCTTRIVTVP